MCDGTDTDTFSVPNIFDTDTNIFSVPLFSDTETFFGTSYFRYQKKRKFPVPIHHTLISTIMANWRSSIMHRDNLGSSDTPEPLRPKTIFWLCLHGKVEDDQVEDCDEMHDDNAGQTWNGFTLVRSFSSLPPTCSSSSPSSQWSALKSHQCLTLKTWSSRWWQSCEQRASVESPPIIRIGKQQRWNHGDGGQAVNKANKGLAGDHPTVGDHVHHHDLGPKRRVHHLPYPVCPPQGRPSLHSGDWLAWSLVMTNIVTIIHEAHSQGVQSP